MEFQLKDFLEAIGPPASLIFSAWIFMTILQSRYQAAFERYRSLVSNYRDGNLSDLRQDKVGEQILLYKSRCETMKTATNVGILSAVFLISTLISAAIQVLLPDVAWIKYISAACALTGLPLVIVASLLVMKENAEIQMAIDNEISDIPELAKVLEK